METPNTNLNVPDQESISRPATPSSEGHHHHRKNHRGGAKERAKRERKAMGPMTPTTPSSIASSSGKKHSHRAGIKYRAKRERQALYRMTSEGMVATYDEEGDGEHYEGEGAEDDEVDRHSDRDAPSLTYDSDNHSEDHEDNSSEHDVTDDIFTHDPVRDSLSSNEEMHSRSEDTLEYQEKIDAKAEVVLKSVKEAFQEQTLVSPPAQNGEETKVPIPSVTLTPPKPQVKQPIKLLSLMRPKVL